MESGDTGLSACVCTVAPPALTPPTPEGRPPQPLPPLELERPSCCGVSREEEEEEVKVEMSGVTPPVEPASVPLRGCCNRRCDV